MRVSLTASYFPNGAFFGGHPQVTGSSVKDHVEGLSWCSNLNGPVVLGVQVVVQIFMWKVFVGLETFCAPSTSNGLHGRTDISGTAFFMHAMKWNPVEYFYASNVCWTLNK